MKLKDKKEIFTKSEKELVKLLSEAKDELFKFTMEHAQRKLKNTRQIFWKKKQISMFLTALAEQKLVKKEDVK